MRPVAFEPHNHTRCIAGAMERADQICADKGVRLTPVRRRVLEVLLEEHRALGAYDVLERLNVEGLGSKPPIAYRALSFLVDMGFAHRVEKLNAFVACVDPRGCGQPALYICSQCGTIAETEVARSVDDVSGFSVSSIVIEIEGICPACLATSEKSK